MELLVYKNEDAEGGVTLITGAYRCAHCKKLSTSYVRHENPPSGPSSADRLLSMPTAHWEPKWVEGAEFPDVPPHISSAASEAYRCSSIGANRAAILMARSVIESSAKHHGITGGFLHAKIEQLEKQGVIRPIITKAALGLKDFGNDMAHGDFEQEVTEEDVMEVLSLMTTILGEVFQTDARTKSLRDRVDARKAEKGAESV